MSYLYLRIELQFSETIVFAIDFELMTRYGPDSRLKAVIGLTGF